MSGRIVERYFRLLADNAALKAENSRLSNFETALNRILDFAEPNSMHNHNQTCVQSAIDWMAGIRESETVENQILKDKLWAAGYDSADTIEDIQQVERALKKFVKMQGEKINELEAELEKCQQDAFNSGRDVQHRIDGRESAGFAELEY